MHIHLLYEFGEDFDRTFKSLIAEDLEITVGENLDGVGEYEILVGAFRDATFFDHSKKLHTLIIPWAGLPKITAEILNDYPQIKVHNIHHNAQVTAEMAITLMLTAMKRITLIDRDFRKSDWRRRYNDEPIQLLSGKRTLVLGYGEIGSHIVSICKAFGMKVSVVKRTQSETENFYTISDLHELLPLTDVILIALPSTPDTRGLFGAEELAMLPDNSTVVNIARGDIIDEKALYNELESGRLRAGLDVWYQYPTNPDEHAQTKPSKYPFGKLDNVVMTPHLAGHSDNIEVLRAEHLARLINQAYNGEPLGNQVDLKLGY